MNYGTARTELVERGAYLTRQAKEIAVKMAEDVNYDGAERFQQLMAEIKDVKGQVASFDDLDAAQKEFNELRKVTQPPVQPFGTVGQFAQAVFQAGVKNRFHPGLKAFYDKAEPSTPENVQGWVEGGEQKDLLENVGASGGFLVPTQQQTQLLSLPAPDPIVRPRATVVPMLRRQIQWPVLDQTNTTSGRPAWFGGVRAIWTEEAAEKTETDPQFRQINLVAHKLVCLTEASDELLEDSAVSIEALLGQLFNGATSWYEENAFLVGTGVGQPLGVIPAGATFAQARAGAGAVTIVDIANMLEHSIGNPVWVMSKSMIPTLIQLNGPAANPSYVFIPNAREGVPGTLFGFPILYSEHAPLLGNRGDIGIYDFRYYLIGSRQATTIMASKHDKFRYDMTVWRSVHRVDGQPWLSQPVYLQDGTTQISPFVVLDAATGS